MKKAMSEKNKQALQAAKERRMQTWPKIREFREDARISQADDLNFCPEVYRNKEWVSLGYYSSLANAVKALAERIALDDESCITLQDWLLAYETAAKELVLAFCGRSESTI